MPFFRPEEFVDLRITVQPAFQANITLSSLPVMSLEY